MARKCQYCQCFDQAPSKYHNVITMGKKPVKVVHCPNSKTKEHEVFAETVACEKFTLSEYLWCEVRNERIHATVCANRRRKLSIEECDKCDQKKDIVDARRGVRAAAPAQEPVTTVRVARRERREEG